MDAVTLFKETKEEGLIKQVYHCGNGAILIRFSDSQGKTHRDNGPAIEINEGYKEWRYHGLFHRVDGSAIVYENGDEEWYIFGKKHREDGPAVTYESGKIQRWFIHGIKHRMIGPATIYHNEKRYYINGKKYTSHNYYSILKIIKKFITKTKKRLLKKLTEKYYQAGFDRDVASIIASYHIHM
jgi:hypothetical protein